MPFVMLEFLPDSSSSGCRENYTAEPGEYPSELSATGEKCWRGQVVLGYIQVINREPVCFKGVLTIVNTASQIVQDFSVRFKGTFTVFWAGGQIVPDISSCNWSDIGKTAFEVALHVSMFYVLTCFKWILLLKERNLKWKQVLGLATLSWWSSCEISFQNLDLLASGRQDFTDDNVLKVNYWETKEVHHSSVK